MEEKMRQIELNEDTIKAINYIQKNYFFGLFKQVGIAQNDEVEYKLRNALDDFKQTTNIEDSLFDLDFQPPNNKSKMKL